MAGCRFELLGAQVMARACFLLLLLCSAIRLSNTEPTFLPAHFQLCRKSHARPDESISGDDGLLLRGLRGGGSPEKGDRRFSFEDGTPEKGARRFSFEDSLVSQTEAEWREVDDPVLTGHVQSYADATDKSYHELMSKRTRLMNEVRPIYVFCRDPNRYAHPFNAHLRLSHLQ